MFAFGLYDSHRGLLLGRDRLGIKPLYYYQDIDAGLLLFASEVKALLKSGCVPDDRDPLAVAGFLLAGSVPAPRTMFKRVYSLPAGHFHGIAQIIVLRERRPNQVLQSLIFENVPPFEIGQRGRLLRWQRIRRAKRFRYLHGRPMIFRSHRAARE